MGAPLASHQLPLALQPDDVLKAAEQLGIQPADVAQTHLLAVAKAFLEAPLPESWTRSLDAHGNRAYTSKRTGQSHAEHPQLSQYQHFVHNVAAHPPKDYERKTCMLFSRPDGTTFIHDFRPEAVSSEEVAEGEGETAPAPAVADQDVVAAAAAETQPQAAPARDPEPAAVLDPPATDQAESSTPTQQEQPGTAEAVTKQDTEEPTATEQPESPAEETVPLPAKEPGDSTPASTEPIPEPDQKPSSEEPQPLPEEPAPAPSAPEASASTPAHDRMIPDIPMVLLESFGLINTEEPAPLGETGVRAGVRKLCYYSWWYEDIESTDLTFRIDGNSVVGGGLKRRYVTLEYHLGTGRFSIVSHNEDQELRIPDLPVVTKAGQAAEIWDLHVGATMTAMGRTLTLHKADLETSNWNDRHAARLKLLKTELLAELQKYKPRAHKNEVAFDRGDKVHSGGLSLRYTVEQIKKLATDLQQYRPAQAEKFRSRINIKL